MHELRKNPRFESIGKAQISTIPKCKLMIKNLSITGCCLECTLDSDKIKIQEKYRIDIKPERKSHIHHFNIEVECKWIRSGENSSEIGFEIYSFPKGKNFQSYVDYLSFHSTLT
jgi:hypothetical protein